MNTLEVECPSCRVTVCIPLARVYSNNPIYCGYCHEDLRPRVEKITRGER